MATPAATASLLSADDVEKLFSGAPQFFDRAEGHGTWAPHPSVAFPFDEELHIRDMTDHAQIEDPAWGCVTAWPHITRGGCEQYADDGSLLPPAPVVESPKRPHFYPRCREKPSMLSAQGLEKGTMGYQAALEAGVADLLQEEQFGFEFMGSRAMAIVEARERIMAGPADGLRQPSEASVLDQLIQCSMRYRAKRSTDRAKASDLYAALFSNLLYPPARILDRRDPKGLPTQVRQLLRVLAAPNIWIDFSQVTWRIKLGQILWGNPGTAEIGQQHRRSGAKCPKNDLGRCDVAIEERYWLLLQILLGCEMLIRLDAITEGDELGVESINATEVRRFETTANDSVKWTLVLARCWLENIEVVRGELTPPPSADQSPALVHASPVSVHDIAAETATPTTGAKSSATGWLSTLTEAVKLGAGHMMVDAAVACQKQQNSPAVAPSPQSSPIYKVQGLHGLRQINGLAHFARKLRWPGADAFAARVLDIRQTSSLSSTDEIATAMSSRTSCFGPNDVKKRFHMSSSTTTPASSTSSSFPMRLKKQANTAVLQPSGWVSKSYLSGLVMPGESLGYMLMASLVENDADALDALGPVANLCGGFSYAGKSFWSTSCIVGRVLAAGKGATECMGWVSSDVTPNSLGDCWIDVQAEPIQGEPTSLEGRRARIWDKSRVENESHVLGSSQPSSVLATDFVVPSDGVYSNPPPRMEIVFEALELPKKTATAPGSGDTSRGAAPGTVGSIRTASSYIHSCTASVSFKVKVADKDTVDYRFELKQNSHFITAHPCVTSNKVRLMRSSPSSPTIRQVDVTESLTKSAKTTCLSGHPLHKAFRYHVIHLSELLERHPSCRLTDFLSPLSQNGRISMSKVGPRRVLVIDCITGFTRQTRSPPSSPLSDSSRRNSEFSDDGLSGLASPSSPVLRRGGFFAHNWPKPGGGNSNNNNDSGSSSANAITLPGTRAQGAQDKMHLESRRRQFGSDMEILVRALCSEMGWSAVVSRRRRGCLACAIREASALGWHVVIRVD